MPPWLRPATSRFAIHLAGIFLDRLLVALLIAVAFAGAVVAVAIRVRFPTVDLWTVCTALPFALLAVLPILVAVVVPVVSALVAHEARQRGWLTILAGWGASPQVIAVPIVGIAVSLSLVAGMLTHTIAPRAVGAAFQVLEHAARQDPRLALDVAQGVLWGLRAEADSQGWSLPRVIVPGGILVAQSGQPVWQADGSGLDLRLQGARVGMRLPDTGVIETATCAELVVRLDRQALVHDDPRWIGDPGTLATRDARRLPAQVDAMMAVGMLPDDEAVARVAAVPILVWARTALAALPALAVVLSVLVAWRAGPIWSRMTVAGPAVVVIGVMVPSVLIVESLARRGAVQSVTVGMLFLVPLVAVGGLLWMTRESTMIWSRFAGCLYRAWAWRAGGLTLLGVWLVALVEVPRQKDHSWDQAWILEVAGRVADTAGIAWMIAAAVAVVLVAQHLAQGGRVVMLIAVGGGRAVRQSMVAMLVTVVLVGLAWDAAALGLETVAKRHDTDGRWLRTTVGHHIVAPCMGVTDTFWEVPPQGPPRLLTPKTECDLEPSVAGVRPGRSHPDLLVLIVEQVVRSAVGVALVAVAALAVIRYPLGGSILPWGFLIGAMPVLTIAALEALRLTRLDVLRATVVVGIVVWIAGVLAWRGMRHLVTVGVQAAESAA